MRADISWEIPDGVTAFTRIHADGDYACAYLTLHTGEAEFRLSGVDGRLQLATMDPASLRELATKAAALADELDEVRAKSPAAKSSASAVDALRDGDACAEDPDGLHHVGCGCVGADL